MRLSQHAIDLILAIVADFDRERGVPHDYYDLEAKLKGLGYVQSGDGALDVEIPSKGDQPNKVVRIHAGAALLEPEKDW